jgi:hypothetical protein
VSRSSPTLLGWATVATVAQLDRQTRLFAVGFTAVGANIALDDHGTAAFGTVITALGWVIVALAGVMAAIFLTPEDLILTRSEFPDKSETSRVSRPRAMVFLGAIAIASLALVVVVAFTGGPLTSPFSQYLVGALVLAQILAPTVRAAWSVVAMTAVLFAVAGGPALLRRIGMSLPEIGIWPAWHYLAPIMIVAGASTWVNVSSIATEARRRRLRSIELARAGLPWEAS